MSGSKRSSVLALLAGYDRHGATDSHELDVECETYACSIQRRFGVGLEHEYDFSVFIADEAVAQIALQHGWLEVIERRASRKASSRLCEAVESGVAAFAPSRLGLCRS